MKKLFLTIICGALVAFPSSAFAFPTGETNLEIFPTQNEELVFNAQSCVKNTHVILYSKSTGCEGGKNEEWTFKKLEDGYDVIYADYAGGDECLNVANGEYKERTYIYASQCNPSSPSANEEFRRPENTGGYFNGDWIVPGRQPILDQFCLNAQGGLFSGAHIILWPCNSESNEAWWFR